MITKLLSIVATNTADLKLTLNVFNQYCNKWKLKINIFNGNARHYKYTFKIRKYAWENVKEFKYLGVTFSKLNYFISGSPNIIILFGDMEKTIYVILFK